MLGSLWIEVEEEHSEVKISNKYTVRNNLHDTFNISRMTGIQVCYELFHFQMLQIDQ